MDDLKKQINSLLRRKDGKLNSTAIRRDKENPNGLVAKIISVTSFLSPSATMSERVYCIFNDMTEQMKCKCCGHALHWSTPLYRYSGCMNKNCSNYVFLTRKKVDHGQSNKKHHQETISNLMSKYQSNDFILLSLSQTKKFINNVLMKTDYGVKHHYVDNLSLRTNINELCSVLHHTNYIPIDRTDFKWNERFYCLMHDLPSVPTCEICGSPKSFNNIKKGYSFLCPNYHKHEYDAAVEGIQKQGFTILQKPDQLIDGKFTLKCEKCGKVFEAELFNARWKHIYCSGCYGDKQVSLGEKELCEYVKSIYRGTIVENYKTSDKIEIDIYLPELKIGIEYDGMYWHSDQNKRRFNLSEKTKYFSERGIQILHFFDFEWENSKEIVKSMIAQKIGVTPNYGIFYARELEIKTPTSAEKIEFLNKNHLQGSDNSSIAYGLYADDELIAIMTFGKRTLSAQKPTWEMIRYCSKINTRVVGGASRLLKHFLKTHKPNKLTTYANLRYSTGNLYEKIGFKRSHVSRPNYWYVKGGQILSRIACQKHKLPSLLKTFDKSLSESENMTNNGYSRLYDCGNIVFVM